MPSDPLSDVLQVVEAKGVISTGLRASGSWSIAVEGHDGLKFNAILEGECWISMHGQEPSRLQKGDCFLLTQGLPFVISTDLDVPALKADEIFACARDHFARFDGGVGNSFVCIGGRMMADGGIDILTRALPPFVLIPAEFKAAGRVRCLLDHLIEEIERKDPGVRLVSEHLMKMIFVELIRAVSTHGTDRTGWLSALSDPRLGSALRLIHSDPGRTWRVTELAAACNLSRSQFSFRFNEAVGMGPIDYLLHWRMALARSALLDRAHPIIQIAVELGYSSESAFGAAFKRVYGKSPGRFVAEHIQQSRTR